MKQQKYVPKNSIYLSGYHTRSIAGIVLLAVLLFSCNSKEIDKVSGFSHPKGAPEIIAEGFEMTYTDSGKTEFTLITPELLIFNDEKEPFKEFPKGFELVQYDKNMEIISSIKGDYGKYYEKTDVWEARINVIAVNTQGDTLKTELLFWDEKKGKIYSEEFVEIIQEDRLITGMGFESNQELGDWQIKKPQAEFYIEVEKED